MAERQSVGEVLLSLREQAGLTRKQVARMMGVTEKRIEELEYEHNNTCWLSDAYELAKIYNTSLSVFEQCFYWWRPYTDKEADEQEQFRAEAQREREAEQADVLNMEIGYLDFPGRARRCFAALEIKTLGDLVQWTADELLEIENFGRGSLQAVKQKLATHKLKLRED